MSQNPLIPQDEPKDKDDSGYVLPGKAGNLQPLSDEEKAAIGANPAAELIRQKLARLYAKEPDALQEKREAEAAKPRSRHQQFMHSLSASGKSLAEIQTDWHNYYLSLSDDEKHEVWQEFYENNRPGEPPKLHEPAPKHARQFAVSHQRPTQVVSGDEPTPKTPAPPKNIREHIRHKVEKRTAHLSAGARQNLHSLLFGLSAGAVVLLFLLFGLFNEVVIAPFIQPGRASATPIIVNSNSVDASGQPQVIIPKINVQIPVVYGLNTINENVIQDALQQGVVHYPSTVKPGEDGNAAFFGHSSNNIFNKGKYKFAFVLLHKLKLGDTFYLTCGGTIYSYKVIERKIVDPSEVSVLDDISGETATATLITCDPPGTSLHRLVVVGRQISPSSDKNSQSSTTLPADDTSQLPGNGPTLWTRIWRSVF
jgi:LPXTG-site transpeptidase (sortase) family protein